ncbi:uncharacterized protein LOC113762640 isoform X1 [Coffea eugenioides]|uniref:uncharacterized protein LOC113757823 isoform X1 n=1 Tax=Coffea eugenioides TaxID=49369 RepID=UPI000F60DCFE|nr:uncharacterized protein LOC113757823 isoform X1 [Coffea eugenioides]XP_027161986.1 uncharacterized protein LOC113762640 isoform X1 [Coffea eugenioides]
MTEVIANYNIKMNEFAANMAVEGFQSAEVEAIMKAVGENKTWNAIEGLSDTNANLQGLCGTTTAQNVDKTVPPDVQEMAEFAVAEYNRKTGTKLVLIKVLAYVKRVVVFGTLYGLHMLTQDDKGIHKDQALTLKFKNGKKVLLWYKHDEH